MQAQSTARADNYSRKRLIFSSIIIFVVIPIVMLIGVTIFNDRKYNLISMIIVLLACVPFFVSFERRKPQAREILTIAVMSAISVAGRAAFIWIPAFKPVTAITAITGFAFGAEAGFLTGSTSAIASNIFFGQGPWTPFQMFTWGILGFIAGLLGQKGWMKSKIALIIYGVFAGIMYSFCMDIWTVISYDGLFSWKRYLIAMSTAIPFTIVYVVSNVVFLLVLAKPIGEKLERIKVKYGMLNN
ncbi:ECF transporter S component [Viridibacillus arvi]|uniref:ECF transporter S component n=1 Tax=Viridibacillus arvi TaxID=263475 RepID=UPI0036C2C1DE